MHKPRARKGTRIASDAAFHMSGSQNLHRAMPLTLKKEIQSKGPPEAGHSLQTVENKSR